MQINQNKLNMSQINLSQFVIDIARRYALIDDNEQAITYLITNYSNLVNENRKLLNELANYKNNKLEQKIKQLHEICSELLDEF